MYYPAIQRHLQLGCGEGLSSWIAIPGLKPALTTKQPLKHDKVKPGLRTGSVAKKENQA